MGGFISGPLAAMVLAEMGADVIKVERPGRGDPFRGFEDGEDSPQFMAHNRHKRSLALDYGRPRGREILHRLLASVDVLVANSRPGVAERLGIGFDQLKGRYPRLIWCAITGFGPDGPYAQRPAFDNVGQALSGWMSRHRGHDETRVIGPAIADPVTSYYAAIGILAALYERERSGRGHKVEVNVLEATIALGMEPIAHQLANGRPAPLYARGAASQFMGRRRASRGPFHMKLPWVALFRLYNVADRATIFCGSGAVAHNLATQGDPVGVAAQVTKDWGQ